MKLATAVYSEKEKAVAWKSVANTVMKLNDELIDQWTKDVDDIPTFVSSSQLDPLEPRYPCTD